MAYYHLRWHPDAKAEFSQLIVNQQLVDATDILALVDVMAFTGSFDRKNIHGYGSVMGCPLYSRIPRQIHFVVAVAPATTSSSPQGDLVVAAIDQNFTAAIQKAQSRI